MSTSPSPLELDPTRIVENNFKGLLAANDVHSLQGALASAEYLRQNTEPSPHTDNMVSYTANLLRQAELNARDSLEQENNPFKRAGYGFVNKYMVARNQSQAIIAFAGYRVASDDVVTFFETERHFYDAIDKGNQVDRGIARNAIINYCRNLARKEEPLTKNEAIAVLAGRKLVSHTSLNPCNARTIASRRRIKRLVDKAV